MKKQVKLRYQMRGLGIGMVITALLMGVATKEGLPLTDAEIRARAVELGMVDSANLSLKDVQGSAAAPTVQPTPDPAAVSGNDGEPEEEPQSDLETDSEEENRSEGQGTQEKGEQEAQTDTGAEAASEPDGMATVVIESGITSSEVCRRLAEAGLIEDAAEFDSYLCSNGYSVKIHAGTYEIGIGTDEEEIIRIITKIR